MKTSSHRRIAFFNETVVAKPNGDVRILIGSCKIAVLRMRCTKQLTKTGATSGGLKLQCIRNCHIFSVLFSAGNMLQQIKILEERLGWRSAARKYGMQRIADRDQIKTIIRPRLSDACSKIT